MCWDACPGKTEQTERQRQRERERLAFPVYTNILPHPSPRPAPPAGRQDPDCRPVPTHVILTRTTRILGLYMLSRAIPGTLSFPDIHSLYIPRVLVHSSRTVHFRVSLSTYPDYPAPHVRSGFGLRYYRVFVCTLHTCTCVCVKIICCTVVVRACWLRAASESNIMYSAAIRGSESRKDHTVRMKTNTLQIAVG